MRGSSISARAPPSSCVSEVAKTSLQLEYCSLLEFYTLDVGAASELHCFFL